MMRVLDARETRDALPYPELGEELARMLERRRAGTTRSPERLVLGMADGATLLAMTAHDGEFACAKLVSVQPSNPARGQPSILGEVVLLDARTGERHLWLDGPTVTARRTAALSALAVRRLAARPDAATLLIGTGAQGLAHIEAFAQLVRPPHLYVLDRGSGGAARAVEHARGCGLAASAVRSAADVLDRVGVIVTATTSRTPTVPAELPAGTCVVAIGAFRPDMAELPAALLHGVPVYVDTVEGARVEAGDLIQAGVEWGRVRALEEAPANPAGGTVVFKSVGDALWDLAAARVARARI